MAGFTTSTGNGGGGDGYTNSFSISHAVDENVLNKYINDYTERETARMNATAPEKSGASGNGRSIESEKEAGKDALNENGSTAEKSNFLSNAIGYFKDKADSFLKQVLNPNGKTGEYYGAGNINLHDRPQFKNADGTISTVDSVGFEIDGKQVLLPSVWLDKDGNPYHSNSDEEILQHYKDTGEYLGKFNTIEESNAYAKALHEEQARYYSPTAMLNSQLADNKLVGESYDLGANPLAGAGKASRGPSAHSQTTSTGTTPYTGAQRQNEKQELAAQKEALDSEIKAKQTELEKAEEALAWDMTGNAEFRNRVKSIESELKDLKDQRDALAGKKRGSIKSWAENVLTAATESTAAGYTDASRTAYAAGQGVRDQYTDSIVEGIQHEYDIALRAYEDELEIANGDENAEAVKEAKIYLDAVEQKLLPYKQSTMNQRGATYASEDLADQLQTESANATAAAKEEAGNTALGDIITDAAINVVQLAEDAPSNLIVPGASLGSMGIRSFGAGTQEARQAGATLGQQFAYGSVKAGIEVATEKMFDGLADLYGAGAFDDIAEGFVKRVAKTETGRAALRAGFGALEEGAEELVSGKADPFAKAIFDNGAALKNKYGSWDNWTQAQKDELYDALIGAVVGFGFSSVEQGANLATGANTEANTTSANVDANTVESKTVQERNTSGENRAEQLAPEAPRENPLVTGTESKTVEERNATGEERAEQNAPNAPRQETTQTAENNAEVNDTTNAETATANESTENNSETVNASEQASENAEVVQDNADNIPSNTSVDTLGTEEVKTQSAVNEFLTDEEAARPELDPEKNTHIQHKDTLVDDAANTRIFENKEQARADLMAVDLETESWNDVDMRTADLLIEEEANAARLMEKGEAQDEAYRKLAELRKKADAAASKAGQTLRQRSRFGGTSADIVSDAAAILYGDNNDVNTRKLSPEKKAEIMDNVNKYAYQLQHVPNGNTSSVIDIIKAVAKIRKTKGLLDIGNIKLNNALKSAANMADGETFLRNLATTQIRSIANDYIDPGFINRVKSYRFINMLSAPATAARNIGANTVFGNLMCSFANNTSAPIDAIMSLATGKRTVGFNKLSSDFVKGSYEAGLKSWLEVTLDAEADQATYAYDEIKGRTFKSIGNFAERFMSALERNQGYQLKTTDQISKGGTEAETKRGLEKLKNSGLTDAEINEIANQEALYRTLQDTNKVTQLTQEVRRVFDKYIHFGNKKTGEYGLGSDIMPFAQVPANSVRAAVQFNPLSSVPSLINVFKVMAKGSKATAMEQHQAAVDFGKAITGASMVAGCAALAAKGVLRYTDHDDKDEKQLDKAQRKSGLQCNIDALMRMMLGEDSTEQDEDSWIGLGWIPQLNTLASMGCILNESYEDTGERPDVMDVSMASFDALKSSIEDFPAVSTITDMMNAYKYAEVDDGSDAPEWMQRLSSMVANKVANTVTGVAVPNVIRANASGLDEYERNMYSSDNQLVQALDYIKAGIPGLRETLPTQKDNFGNEITNVGGFQNWLNKVILPGAVTKDMESTYIDNLRELAKETGDLSVIPDKSAPSKISYKGTDYELSFDQGEAYVARAGQEYEKLTSELFNNKAYADMDSSLKDAIARDIRSYAYDMAKQEFLEGQGVEYTSAIQKLMDGVDKPGKSNDRIALDPENVVQYYTYKNMYDSATDEDMQTDYATVDKLTKLYNKMPENLQAVIDERFSGFKSVKQMADIGVNSKNYYTLKDSVAKAQDQLDKSNPNGDTNFLGLVNADIPDSVKRTIIENGDYLTKARKSAYDILTPYGYSIAEVYDFFDKMDYQVNRSTGEAKSSGTISALECAVALSKETRLTETQKVKIYNAMKSAYSNFYNDWGKYTYESEVKYAAKQTRYTYGKETSSRTGGTSGNIGNSTASGSNAKSGTTFSGSNKNYLIDLLLK